MTTIWPKNPPQLSPEQLKAREGFMKIWHEELPSKYALVERFNHGFVAKLPIKTGSRTLEIGAGLGEHSRFEDLTQQDYFSLEYRESFCNELRKLFSAERVICGDIHQKQNWQDQFFDRIIAIHVLEHLVDLPKALNEISRLLKDDGVFDIVIPAEGAMLYSFARKISAERVFRKNFKMDYTPIIRNEHVSTYSEILEVINERFIIEKQKFFPSLVPIPSLNICIGFRLRKRLR